MYCDEQARYEQARYEHNDFGQLLDIMDHYNDVLHHVWVIELASQIKNVAFQFYGWTYMLYK
jgi:hypothetical protein